MGRAGLIAVDFEKQRGYNRNEREDKETSFYGSVYAVFQLLVYIFVVMVAGMDHNPLICYGRSAAFLVVWEKETLIRHKG
jgi:hypothetical protein